MVINKNGTVEQVTHYYPYGGVIGDISTNENLQKYKLLHYIPREQARSEGKELDRTFGLDNYDIHARQYFAMAPMWDKIDPLAEDSPQFSPYSYCMGDPVNLGDFNGMIPDSLEAALLSQDAYNPNFGEGPGKWSCISRSLGGSFKWAIYTKGEGDGQEFVLAFAGTDDLYDRMTDLYQGVGAIDGESNEYELTEFGKAIKVAEGFNIFIGGKEGTIVGHSLGASLGSIGTFITRLPSIVFTPAAIHDNTLSTFNLETTNHQDLIQTFVVKGELISIINKLTPNAHVYGTVHVIKNAKGDVKSKHSIQTIIDALKR